MDDIQEHICKDCEHIMDAVDTDDYCWCRKLKTYISETDNACQDFELRK